MEIDLSNIYSLSLKIFTILKEEYSIYLSKDKLDFLNNLDIFKFYKLIDNKDLPPIYYLGDTYYINSNFDLNLLEQYVPFLCLSSLCSNLNPLKIGLIEKELVYLKDKYELNINTYFIKELEIADLISKTILSDISYKLLFKDSDADIVKYLISNSDSKIGMIYLKISKTMQETRKETYIYDNKIDIDYSKTFDIIYEFINEKTKLY